MALASTGTEEFWEHVLAALLELDSSSYYELLGVASDASPGDVRAHYERRSLQLHPNAHQAEPDTERRHALQLLHTRLHEAYAVLSNATSRKRYDAGLARGKLRIHTTSHIPTTAPPAPPAGKQKAATTADTPSRVDVARALFDQGKRMAKAGDLRGAKVKWEMALHVLPTSKAIRAALEKLRVAMSARTEARHPISRPVNVACGSWEQFRTMYTRDISRGGMFLASDTPLAIGILVTVSLALPDNQTLELEAQVAHVASPESQMGSGMGLQFLNMSPATKAKVEAFMTSGREPSRSDIPAKARGRATNSEIAVGDAPPADLLIREQLLDVLVEMRVAVEHDVLGVPPDAEPGIVRSAYLQLAKRFHPDLYGRYRDGDITEAASEASYLVRQAYEAIRERRVAAARQPVGAQTPSAVPIAVDRSLEDSLPVRSLLGDELFEGEILVANNDGPDGAVAELSDVAARRLGREALQAGRYAEAVECFARALDLSPRDRILRAAFHLASAYDAKAARRVDAAREHFETVLLFDKQCEEAINELRRTPGADDEPKRSIFDRLFRNQE